MGYFVSAAESFQIWGTRVVVATAVCVLYCSDAGAAPNVVQTPLVQGEQSPGTIRLVQRRGRRLPGRQQLKAMEEYFDDLEDFYDDRDPQLADYYERMENYYEDLRKGRAAYPPRPFHLPQGVVIDPRWEGPGLPGPAFDSRPPPRPRRPPHPGQPINPQLTPYGVQPQLQAAPRDPQQALTQAYQELLTQLSGLSTGQGWKRYLQLPVEPTADAAALDTLWTQAEKEQARRMLERFDQVSHNPDFRVIANLPAFHGTHRALRAFVGWLGQQPTVDESQSPRPAEEIPLPPPGAEATTSEGPIIP